MSPRNPPSILHRELLLSAFWNNRKKNKAPLQLARVIIGCYYSGAAGLGEAWCMSALPSPKPPWEVGSVTVAFLPIHILPILPVHIHSSQSRVRTSLKCTLNPNYIQTHIWSKAGWWDQTTCCIELLCILGLFSEKVSADCLKYSRTGKRDNLSGGKAALQYAFQSFCPLSLSHLLRNSPDNFWFVAPASRCWGCTMEYIWITKRIV